MYANDLGAAFVEQKLDFASLFDDSLMCRLMTDWNGARMDGKDDGTMFGRWFIQDTHSQAGDTNKPRVE